MKTFLTSFRMLAACSLLTGALYPLAVWAIGQIAFRDRAEGSLLERDGHIVGSTLLAQKTTNPRYFWPRPSAGDYATVASGASNLAWSSAKLARNTTEAAAAFRAANHLSADTVVPADAITTSGSGLDPELSVAGVRLQAARVAAARFYNDERRHALDALITRLTRGGAFTPARVNVLELNLALDHDLP